LVWGSKGLEKRKDEEVKGCRSGWLVEGKETEMGVEKGVKSDEGVWKGGGGSTDRRERVSVYSQTSVTASPRATPQAIFDGAPAPPIFTSVSTQLNPPTNRPSKAA
jgi:hypothetical protein